MLLKYVHARSTVWCEHCNFGLKPPSFYKLCTIIHNLCKIQSTVCSLLPVLHSPFITETSVRRALALLRVRQTFHYKPLYWRGYCNGAVKSCSRLKLGIKGLQWENYFFFPKPKMLKYMHLDKRNSLSLRHCLSWIYMC